MAERPLDMIHIKDLVLRCVLGVREEERRDKQDVIINLRLYADLAEACLTDRLDDSFDYRELKKIVIATVEQSSFYLVERLAEKIAQVCLAEPKVVRVAVEVDKPGALRFARSVGVQIVRERATDDGPSG